MILVVGTAIGIFFVLRYAERVKADPTSRSSTPRRPTTRPGSSAADAGSASGATLTGPRSSSSALFFLAFGVMIYGVIPWEDLGIGLPTLWWWFPEMTASFLFFAILIGVVGRMAEADFTTTFVDGARDLLGVALIIGIARGITVDHEQRADHRHRPQRRRAGGGGPGRRRVHRPDVRALPAAVVPDPVVVGPGDGRDADHGARSRASPTFPPQLVVTAYQTANGLVNLVTPTSAVVMGGLAIARVGYGTWLKFVWPVLILLAILTVVVLVVSTVVLG